VTIARRVVVRGTDAREVATRIATALAGDGLAIAFVFADWRLDQTVLAADIHDRLAAHVVGCATVGIVSERTVDGDLPAVAAIGLYGDWVRAGVGVAAELSRYALVRSRDAVGAAAAAIGETADTLDPARHVVVTLVDGLSAAVEPFCIGSAAAVPQLEVVGGCAAIDVAAPSERGAAVWVDGNARCDAGLAIVLAVDRPFHVVTSAHVVPTPARTVVTAAAGRVVSELDGKPAVARMRALLADAGLDVDNLVQYSFARYIDKKPYVRSLTHVDADGLHFASAVEPGHVLRVMRPGDLIGTTRRDLAAAAERVGGNVEALLAFSCMGRHWQATADNLVGELAAAYASYPTVGFHSYGEQIGMLLVNHTLTGLVIG
jgi:hypothetical protein